MKPKIRLVGTQQKISFRIDAEIAGRMREAARKEAIPTNLTDFTKTLLLWALPHYRAASSLRVLRRTKLTVLKFTPGSARRD